MMNDVRGDICRIISAMLDSPDEYGIYPTTKCYDALEQYIQSALAAAETERERYRKYGEHLFVTPGKSDSDPHQESCAECKMNLRDPIHRRAALEQEHPDD